VLAEQGQGREEGRKEERKQYKKQERAMFSDGSFLQIGERYVTGWQ